MIKKISSCLNQVSRGWVVVAALAIFVLFSALVLPGQAAKSETDAGTPDLSLYYSPTKLYEMAEAYGENGRQAYIQARFTFDLAWPLVYTFFLSTAISWFTNKWFAPGSRWQRGNLAPLFGAVFDYLENLSTSLVMIRYPDRTPIIDILAPVFTLVKWVFVAGSFVLLLAAIGVGAWRLLKTRIGK
jgi:hypothetical protein